MLSTTENAYLTKVGPGTPMGNLFRRFWLPAMLSQEIEADGAPARLRLLGEDLVGFRDSSGRPAILDAYCPHKRAPLFFGRNEQDGLRCVYHGWKFNADGSCVDMPSEPEDSNFKAKVRIDSYPVREQAGVIWIYMGPAEKEPVDLPGLEWVRAPEGHQVVTKWLQRTNWAQGMEGEIDTSHISFLHVGRGPDWDPEYRAANNVFRSLSRDPKRTQAALDGSPVLTLRETDYGYTYGARRNAGDGDYYWRVTRWLYPFYSLIPGSVDGTNGRCWVPIDDHHTWTFGYQNRETPYSPEEVAEIWKGAAFPPRVTRGTFRLPDGYTIDTWLPVANVENDYLLDREMQRYGNYTGIWGINEQDRSLQEGMGPIVDRSREHLGTSDIATIAARRLLIKMARDLENGVEPDCVRRVDSYRVRAIDVVSPLGNFDELLGEKHAELGVAKF